ncbi:glycosyltransferase family 2 protein [Providencia sp. Me31A]|uniref:glycosyltransferase family 2 protein n=1 Tax=Providencia sp. Me31A TaxID=3392637 RepID=UPI003D2D5373
MKLSMLYATYDDRLISLIEHLPEAHYNTEIIIIHQTRAPHEYQKHIDLLNNRKDIRYFSSNDKGVTKSRNLAIAKSTGEILLFCDDDVIYNGDIQKNILNAYRENIHAGFLTFAYTEDIKKIKSKKFKDNSFKHTLLTILSIGTIQISCKKALLTNLSITFPEDMGAGSKYFLCDEPVFLSNFIKSGIDGYYIPISIGYHPVESSGNIFNNKNAFISRLLCFKRIFGKFNGSLLYIIYLFKNIKKFDSIHSFTNAISLITKREYK